MKTVTEVCVPRADILAGRSSDDIYAANLSLVRDGRAPSVYQDPSEFFKNTYPTEGLKTTIHEVFSRLEGKDEGSPVIKLETSLGGGKTHSLISLFHIARGGSATPGAAEFVAGMTFKPMKVAAIIGTELSVVRKPGEPLTIWGILGKELGGDQGYELMKGADEQMSAPGEKLLYELLGRQNCLILVDEMAIYLAKAATVSVGQSDLARQTAAFLQELSSVCSARSNAVMVITSLDKEGVFRQGTELMTRYLDDESKINRGHEAIGDAEKVLSRVMKTLTPTKGEEFSAVVLRRLFDRIDSAERDKVCQAYMKMLSADANVDYLPGHARNGSYLKNLESSYPFHPELINVLRTKTSSIPNFNKTRGVLRLLSKVVRSTWNGKGGVYLIHPYSVDMGRQEFVEEIVSRLDRGEFQAAIAKDISDKSERPRASIADALYNEPLGTMICNVIFLHSITGAKASDTAFGASEPEIHLAIARPGFDLKKSEDALKVLENNCFYLVRHGSNFAFNTEPNLNKVIENAKDNVEQTRVIAEIEDRIQSMYGGKRYFSPIFFANEPSSVSDDTEKCKLVITHFRDCTMRSRNAKKPTEVVNIYAKAGSQGAPRIYANNLCFLIADEEEVSKMLAQGRNYLALSQLVKDMDSGASYLTTLTSSQKDKLRNQKKENDLYLKIAIMVCYRNLLLPTEQSDLEASGSLRPLRHLIMRVTDSEAKSNITNQKSMEDALVEFLRGQGAARTADDNPLSPEFVLEALWDKKRESFPADEFRKLFYRRPSCGLILTDELIKRSLKMGLEMGRWVVLSGADLYEKSNSSLFYAALDGQAEIILVDSEKYRDALTSFYCPDCKKRKKECRCKEELPPVDKCDRCGRDLPDCVCHRDGDLILDNKVKLERAAGDLIDKARERGVERFSSVSIQAADREALVKLLMALPQFGKCDMKFNLAFTINQRPQGGNYVSMKFEGNRSGLDAIKSVIVNYEAKQPFSSHDLQVEIAYPEGIVVKDFCEILGTKVGQFTSDALFSFKARPKDVGQ